MAAASVRVLSAHRDIRLTSAYDDKLVALKRDLPSQLLDLVADRARRCLEILTSTHAREP